MTDHAKTAREIIEKLIEYDAWRDNLHVNNFPMTKVAITTALERVEREAYERAAMVVDEYEYGLADEHIPDEKSDAYNMGCEDSKVDISAAIRRLATKEGKSE
jgi:hypothetical protein